MTAEPSALYAGLDQMIARPTRPAAASTPNPGAAPQRQDADAKGLSIDHDHDEMSKAHPEPADRETSNALALQPDPPDAPTLYRKQTLQFGVKDLAAVQRLQEAMTSRSRPVSKNDLVRAGLEFLAKDLENNQDGSYVVRKFTRR